MGLLDNNSVSFRDPGFYKKKRDKEKELGYKLTRKEYLDNYYVQGGGAVR